MALHRALFEWLLQGILPTSGLGAACTKRSFPPPKGHAQVITSASVSQPLTYYRKGRQDYSPVLLSVLPPSHQYWKYIQRRLLSTHHISPGPQWTKLQRINLILPTMA